MASRATDTPVRDTRPAWRQASLGNSTKGNPLPRVEPRMAEAKPSELQDIWRRYKSSGGQDLRDRLILTYAPLVKYVAGRLGTGPAGARRGGRPGLLRPARPDRRDRALRARPRHQVRDLRDHPHQGLDHRRAALAGLGAALGAQPRPRDRARRWSSSSTSSSARRPTRRSPAELGITESEFQDSLTRSRARSVAALDELWTISSSGGDTVSLIDTIEDPNADDPSTGLTRTEMREALADAIQRLPEREQPRHHALLLRGADAARDRRGARRDRVPRLAAAHEGDPAPEGASCRARSSAPPLERVSLAPAAIQRLAGVRVVSTLRPSDQPRAGEVHDAARRPRRSATWRSSATAAPARRRSPRPCCYEAGAINRLGSVADGTTVSDSRRGRAAPRHVDLGAARPTASGRAASINLIDTPGDPELPGRRARCAAGRRGSARSWSPACSASRSDRAAVAALRRARPRPASSSSTCSTASGPTSSRRSTALQAQLSERCVAIELPIGAEHEFHGVIDLLHMVAYEDAGDGAPRAEPGADPRRPAGAGRRVARQADGRRRRGLRRAHGALPRGRARSPRDELAAALKELVSTGELFPVGCGAATKQHRHARPARPDRRGAAVAGRAPRSTRTTCPRGLG